MSARGPASDGSAGAASRPAEAPPPAAPAESSDVDDQVVEALTDALICAGYRAVIPFAVARRSAVRRRAVALVGQCFQVADVQWLARLAEAKTSGDSGALLAHWIDGDEWRAVLDEQRMKRKELDLRPVVVADERDPVIDGRHREVSEPKLAASVLDDVLPKRAEGA